MLKSISWQNFVMVAGWLLIGWYCFVGMAYYNKDIRKFIKFKNMPLDSTKQNIAGAVKENPHDVFTRAHQLRNDIAQVLQHATQYQFPKEELVMALQLSVREYPELRQSAFQVAINHYISQETEKQCSTTFSDNDLHMIWTN